MIPKRASAGLLAAGLLALVLSASRPPEHSNRDPLDDAIREARAIITRFQVTSGAPALQIAVALDGRIVWSEAFGIADVERSRPASTQSRFRIASVSKLLTGTLTAQLADAGLLDLDRPIGAYLPDLPLAWHPITARMLVHHASGIAHYADEYDGLDTTRYATTLAALDRFRNRPLSHAPGTGITYSSYAYTVLALLIEKVTGRPFPEVMQTRILSPLGMMHTTPDWQASPSPDRTAFYDRLEDGTVRLAPYVDLSGRWAGSGYLSSAEDLVRFGMAHTRPGILSKGTLALLPERYQLPNGEWSPEGFGWGPREDWDGRAMLWGDGGTPGARGGLLVYPQDGLVIAILTNARGVRLERGEFQALARLFFAAKEGRPIAAATSRVHGNWRGRVSIGANPVPVALTLGDTPSFERDSMVFRGWRSFRIAGAVQLGDTTWLFPLDEQGLFPVTLIANGDSLTASAPRAGWSFSLGQFPVRQ